MKKFKKIVGYDKEAEKEFNEQLELKNNHYEALIEYITRFINKDIAESFKEDFLENFKTTFLEKHRADFPPIVKDYKIFELCEVNLVALENLETQYNKIKLDDYNPAKGIATKPDFNIYVHSEVQVREYDSLLLLCDVLNQNLHRLKNGVMEKNQISFSFGFGIYYNTSSHTYEVNLSYLKTLNKQ